MFTRLEGTVGGLPQIAGKALWSGFGRYVSAARP
jgi:hypothetical protein